MVRPWDGGRKEDGGGSPMVNAGLGSESGRRHCRLGALRPCGMGRAGQRRDWRRERVRDWICPGLSDGPMSQAAPCQMAEEGWWCVRGSLVPSFSLQGHVRHAMRFSSGEQQKPEASHLKARCFAAYIIQTISSQTINFIALHLHFLFQDSQPSDAG